MPSMMSIDKTVNKSPSVCQNGSHWSCGFGFGKKILVVLVGVLLVYLIAYIGVMMRYQLKRYQFVGKADTYERTIVVSGYGKATGTNDIAVTTIGFSNVDKDVAKAQVENKRVMDKIMNELKTIGIADKDLQTNYSVYPEYNYTEQQGQELKGYRVNNQVTVKIRDLSKIAGVLGLAGKYGATEVSGLSFTVDDLENLKSEARDIAVVDAKMKAKKLSAMLSVTLGAVVNYNEYEGSANSYQPMKYGMVGAEVGGGEGSFAPDAVASGSRDVVMNATVTYQILP